MEGVSPEIIGRVLEVERRVDEKVPRGDGPALLTGRSQVGGVE